MAQTTIFKPERRPDVVGYVLVMFFIGLASAALALDDGGISRAWKYARSLVTTKNETGLQPAAVHPRPPVAPKVPGAATRKQVNKLEMAP